MIGFGYDSHRFQPSGSLVIGGVLITEEFGVTAHSDGDVLLHALIDALLGAAGLVDRGMHFPDNDKLYADANSKDLLRQTLSLLENYKIVNIDATVILEKPKLSSFKEQIRLSISNLCNVDIKSINIKAKSNEKMGFIGRNEGLACFCVCQLDQIDA